jgi:hypothetical protein
MFAVRTRVESTAHTRDEAFNRFFRDSATNVLLAHKIQPRTIAQLFPVILSRLVATLCTPDGNVGEPAFVALVHVLQTVDQQQQQQQQQHAATTPGSPAAAAAARSPALVAWLYYAFDNARAYDDLTRYWLRVRQSGGGDARLNWLLFGMILKSMALKVAASGELARGGRRTGWFTAPFVALLTALVRSMFKPREHSVLRDVVRDLPRVLERGAALRLIYEYAEWLRLSDADRDFGQRALLFHELAKSEQLLSLCLPMPVQADELPPDQIDERLMARHTLVALLLRQLALQLQLGLPIAAATQNLIDVLYTWTARIDLDPRIQRSAAARVASADLFLPLVTLLSEHRLLIVSRVDNEALRLRLLRCVLFVVKNCSRALLRAYYRQQTQLVQDGLLALLGDALRIMRNVMTTPVDALPDASAAAAATTAAAGDDVPATAAAPAGSAAPRARVSSSAAAGAAGAAAAAGEPEVQRPRERQPTMSELELWTTMSVSVIDVVHG